MSHKKKICIVTGGTGGIGVSISKRLSDDGFLVVATCRPQSKSDMAALQENLFGGDSNIHIYPADVSNYESCIFLINKITDNLGKVAVLINNAGITDDSSFKKMTLDQWKSVISNNLDSVFNLSSLVFSSMCADGWGRIVNISSINAQKGQFGQANYAAAKAGMLGFTKSLALEGARHGVTVNSISPGYIATKMVTDLSDKIISSIISEIPVGRLGKPEEVAHTVSFLLDEKAGFVTGSNVAMNGGHHMY
jgi:acetoacetyl-CoA reductase